MLPARHWRQDRASSRSLHILPLQAPAGNILRPFVYSPYPKGLFCLECDFLPGSYRGAANVVGVALSNNDCID